MENSTYFPHLATNDLWLFLKTNSVLKVLTFQDMKTYKKK